MARYGYARCSTTHQDTAVQIERLTAAECDIIREEKASGTSRSHRPELQTLLDFIRDGDVLIVTKLDRLARSTRDLHNILGELKEKGADLVVLDQQIDTSTPAGAMFFTMLAAVSQFETELRAERVREGTARAKAQGKYLGRPKKIDDARLVAAYDELQCVSAVCRQEGVSRNTVYRALRRNRAAA
jgi:DNA invertase Pin-like site-specific DNA recombinase